MTRISSAKDLSKGRKLLIPWWMPGSVGEWQEVMGGAASPRRHRKMDVCVDSCFMGLLLWKSRTRISDEIEDCFGEQSIYCMLLNWQIFLAISDLPSLREEEFYSCYFQDYESPAVLTESGIMCPSPDPNQTPALPAGAGQWNALNGAREAQIVLSRESTFGSECQD